MIANFQSMFELQPCEQVEKMAALFGSMNGPQSELPQKEHTLEAYSYEHFRYDNS